MITENTKTTKGNEGRAFYDWANSVYSLVITSTIFPIYYAILTTAYEKMNMLQKVING